MLCLLDVDEDDDDQIDTLSIDSNDHEGEPLS